MEATSSAVKSVGQMPARESAKASSRGGLVLPVILIISISLLTTCGLVWTSAQVLNKNAQAATRSLANSMLAGEAQTLRNLTADNARSADVARHLVERFDSGWATENIGRHLADSYGLSASLVISGDDRTVFASVEGRRVKFEAFDIIPHGLRSLVERARDPSGNRSAPVSGLVKFNGFAHLVAVGPILAGPSGTEPAGGASQPVLVLARPLDGRFLRQAGAAYNLQNLNFFEEAPPQSFYPMLLKDGDGNAAGYLAWRNAWPGDVILWRLTPSLACALLAMTYVLFIFFRSTDLVLERQAALVSSLNRERELRDLKTQFVSMVSHELRTPLSTIRSAADLIDRYDGRMTAEERKRELGAIRTAVTGLTKMIENVLAFGRSDSAAAETHSTRFNLGGFCRQLWNETARAMSAEHRLVLSGKAADKQIYTDETFLRAALSNLFQNAIKYSPGCDHVAVEIIGDKADCTIKVTDFGPGIPSDERDAIFEAFHRGAGAVSTSGTGLGLAVAKASAERLGGRIEIAGEPGRGTTFELVLPGLLKARPSKDTRKDS